MFLSFLVRSLDCDATSPLSQVFSSSPQLISEVNSVLLAVLISICAAFQLPPVFNAEIVVPKHFLFSTARSLPLA